MRQFRERRHGSQVSSNFLSIHIRLERRTPPSKDDLFLVQKEAGGPRFCISRPGRQGWARCSEGCWSGLGRCNVGLPCPASLPETGIFSVATVHSGGSLAAPLHSSLYCDTRRAALPAGRHSKRDRRVAHTSGGRMTKRVLSPGYRDLLNFYKRCALCIAALVSTNLNEQPSV